MADEPGWYPDPLGRQRWRYFDGVEWTSDTRSSGSGSRVATEVDEEPDWDDDDLTEAQLLARARGELPEEDDEDAWVAEPDEEGEDDHGPVEPRSASWSDDGLGWDQDALAWLAETDDLWTDGEVVAEEPEPEPDVEPGPEEEPPVVVDLEPLVVDDQPPPAEDPDPEPAPGLDPAAPAGDPRLDPGRPAHLAPDRAAGRRELAEVVRTRQGGRAVYRRRRAVLALVLLALVAAVGIVVVRPMLEGAHSLDARHAVLRYEGDTSGVTGTMTEVVVDGDDLLQERKTGSTHSVSLIEGRTSYTCRLDARPSLCVRSFDAGSAAVIRSAAAFYLDPLSADGTFGSSGADAQPAKGRTVAGRASRCSTVRVAGKSEPYTVCRDADLGFLTYAKGPGLDLTLTSAKGPERSDISVPDVKVQDERNS
jgi:hypothetical protein